MVEMSGQLEKAQFDFEKGGTLTVQYNPTKLQLDRSASWNESKQQGSKSGLEFQKVSPANLSMELMFDTSIEGDDVRELFVNRLVDAMLPKITYKKEEPSSAAPTGGGAAAPAGDLAAGMGEPVDKKRPPKVTFRWGKMAFLGVIKDVKASYIMFNAMGYPVRAKVTLSLQEFIPPVKMTIGTGTEAGYNIAPIKLVQMQQGQTLSMVAGMAGTTAQVLADMNGFSDPMNVPAGAIVKVPLST
jgi:hypothetical protein